MKRTALSLLPIAAACTLLSLPLQAQQLPVRGPIPFASYDRDGNGYISEEEFNTVQGERLSSRAAQGAPMRGAATASRFADFDTDGDGRISPEELAAGQQAQQQQRRDAGMGMGQGPGMGGGMGRNMPAFADYDLDGNGAITEQEFNEARSRRISERAQQGYPMRNLGNAPAFADVDTNGDGVIDPEEFAAHQGQNRP
jgi:Ca2+-binding EF-hand superfamily protein